MSELRWLGNRLQQKHERTEYGRVVEFYWEDIPRVGDEPKEDKVEYQDFEKRLCRCEDALGLVKEKSLEEKFVENENCFVHIQCSEDSRVYKLDLHSARKLAEIAKVHFNELKK